MAKIKLAFQRLITSSVALCSNLFTRLFLYSILKGGMALLLLFRQLFLVPSQRSVCVTRRRLPNSRLRPSLVDLGEVRSIK